MVGAELIGFRWAAKRMIALETILVFIIGFIGGMVINYGLSKFVFKNLFNKKAANKIKPKPLFLFECVQNVLSFIVGFTFILLPFEQFIILMVAWLAIQVVVSVYIFNFSKWSHGITFAGCDTLTDVVIGALGGASGTMTLVPTVTLLQLLALV